MVGQVPWSDLDENIQQLMDSKSDKVEMWDNTTASDDSELINNIINDLITLVNKG